MNNFKCWWFKTISLVCWNPELLSIWRLVEATGVLKRVKIAGINTNRKW